MAQVLQIKLPRQHISEWNLHLPVLYPTVQRHRWMGYARYPRWRNSLCYLTCRSFSAQETSHKESSLMWLPSDRCVFAEQIYLRLVIIIAIKIAQNAQYPTELNSIVFTVSTVRSGSLLSLSFLNTHACRSLHVQHYSRRPCA